MFCRGKISSYLGQTFFILVDNSFIELTGSNLKYLGKARTLLTPLSTSKQRKRNMQHNAWQAET